MQKEQKLLRLIVLQYHIDEITVILMTTNGDRQLGRFAQEESLMYRKDTMKERRFTVMTLKGSAKTIPDDNSF